MRDKSGPPRRVFNTTVSSADPSPEERAALLEFEKLFGLWCEANERALQAQRALWDAMLQPGNAAVKKQLAEEAETLRDRALELYEQVLAAHRKADR
jgi:hypothetical protein